MADHSFDPLVAEELGVNAAILYRNIQHWCEKNLANNKHIHDGLKMREKTKSILYPVALGVFAVAVSVAASALTAMILAGGG